MLKLATMKTMSTALLPPRIPLAAAMLLALTTLSSASTIELNQPYTPAGQNYSITALQNLTPLTLDGGTAIGANPNANFEFQGGIGVRYTNDAGKLVNFGIGLYDASSAKGIQAASTGLNIAFDQLVSSNGLSATLGDFDLTSLDSGFNTGKVAPTISIYGAGGSLLGNFGAADILADHALTLLSSHDSILQVDTWKLNLNALVGSNAQVSGFTLAADAHNGMGGVEKVASDPYFLVSVSDCVMVPEPGSAFLILSAGLGTLIITRRRSRNLFSAR
jgi:hypothetical protein